MKNLRPRSFSRNNLTRCPVCGARWFKGMQEKNGLLMRFECGGAFGFTRRKVSVETPCPVPSDIAAKALTDEQCQAEVA